MPMQASLTQQLDLCEASRPSDQLTRVVDAAAARPVPARQSAHLRRRCRASCGVHPSTGACIKAWGSCSQPALIRQGPHRGEACSIMSLSSQVLQEAQSRARKRRVLAACQEAAFAPAWRLSIMQH